MAETKVSTITADGVDVFYRSAGSPSSPVILLLHGFPSSSHMFRNLIPLLAKQYRVIAPDLPGYGFTTVPKARKYKYTFENLTLTTEAFLDALKIQNFAVYIFDYGAPVAFRLALHRPKAITAIIAQNGNAYEEGLGKDFWEPVQAYWKSGSKEDRDKLDAAFLTYDTTKWQYTFGSPHADSIPPESYQLDSALLERPGNHDIQLDLLYDYRTNLVLYPQFQQYLATSGVPVLAVWGKNDIIFVAAGAEAYKKNVKDIEIHYFDAGHFTLEHNEVEFSRLITDFLKKRNI